MKKILLLFLICIIFITGCKNLAQKEVTSLVDTISTTLAGEVEVNSYTIYGRFFNLEGTLKEEINNPVLVFKSKGNEEEYSLFSIENPSQNEQQRIYQMLKKLKDELDIKLANNITQSKTPIISHTQNNNINKDSKKVRVSLEDKWNEKYKLAEEYYNKHKNL